MLPREAPPPAAGAGGCHGFSSQRRKSSHSPIWKTGIPRADERLAPCVLDAIPKQMGAHGEGPGARYAVSNLSGALDVGSHPAARAGRVRAGDVDEPHARLPPCLCGRVAL